MDECLTQFRLVLLIGFIGQALADDKPLSDSSIAALSIVFGFIALVLVLSLLCYCVRKKKHLNRTRRKDKLQEIKKVFEEHYSEFTPSSDEMVVISSNEKPLKYSEWRNSQSTTNLNTAPLIVTAPPTAHDSRYMVRTSRTARSISPTRTSPRTPIYERGRSRQRFVYPSQSSHNTLVYNKRSKSAPNLNRREYVPSNPNRQLVYTKSHYLAIKQPFSKKFLLPPVPVRTYYTERPSVKRVVVPAPPPPQRQVIVAPPKREVIKPNVYHVQYKPSPNQIVHRGKVHEHIDEDFRLQTTDTQTRQYQNTYQNYRSQEEPIHMTYKSYEEPAQTTYRTYNEPIQTTLTNYEPRVVRPEPYVYKISNSEGGEIKTTTWSGENSGVNTQLLVAPEGESAFHRTSTYTMKFTDGARVANGTDQNRTVSDDYTIVDFVDADGNGRRSDTFGSSTTGVVTVIATSTSNGEVVHNSSALNALDNLLGDKSSKSSSSRSSSSSSSRKSS